MSRKYLYGKKKFLWPLIKGESGPRFSDLSHYSRLENEVMRDRETSKQFYIDRYTNRLEIDGYVFNPDHLISNPTLSFPVRHCYCLCLSNRKNSEELFEKFQADICIEIDINKLLEVLNLVLSDVLGGMEIQAKNVTYYDPIEPPPTQDGEEWQAPDFLDAR